MRVVTLLTGLTLLTVGCGPLVNVEKIEVIESGKLEMHQARRFPPGGEDDVCYDFDRELAVSRIDTEKGAGR